MKKTLFTLILAAVYALGMNAVLIPNGMPDLTWFLYKDSVYYYVDIDDDFDTRYSRTNAYPSDIPMQATVNEHGAVEVDVPLELPDAGIGLKPDLALHYNSMQLETMFGNEWSLSGLSQIRRVPKSIYYDGLMQSVDENKAIDGTEAFTLNGKRLIILENHFPHSVNYQSETGNIKAKAYFIQRPSGTSQYEYSYFEVFYPNGKTAVFGFEEAAQNQSKKQFPITRISDGLGNEVHYNYIFSFDEYRISQISFGKNKIAGIDFFYKAEEIIYARRETADEIAYQVGYDHGYGHVFLRTPPAPFMSMKTDCLLSRIAIKYNNEDFRTYQLTHHSDGKHIFLSSIQLLKKKSGSGNTNPPDAGSNNEDSGLVVLQNDTAEFTLPLRFRYGENNSHPFEKHLESFTYRYSNHLNTQSKKGIFGHAQTSGIVVYPEVNTFFNGPECPASENIVIKPDLNYPGTFTLPAGAGFLDVICLDLDGKPGNEIVKINNYISENVGELDEFTGLLNYPTDDFYADFLAFSVYTINDATNELSYLYTKTFPTAFRLKDDRPDSRPVYKEFFSGDFNGDGQNEILAVSSLRTTYENRYEIPHGEIYDLESGSVLYRDELFSNIASPNNSSSTTYPPPDDPILAVTEYRAALVAGDFNADGKTDFLYKPATGTQSALIEFDFATPEPQVRKLGNDFYLSSGYMKFYPGDFNGDGKTDLYSWNSVYLSDGKKLNVKYTEEIETRSNVIPVAVKDMNDDGQSDLTFVKPESIETYFFDKGEIIAAEVEKTGLPNAYVLSADNYRAAEPFRNELVFVNGDSLVRLFFGTDRTKPLVMTGVKSGFGVTTHFEYAGLSDENTYTVTGNATFPYEHVLRNSVVVNKMRTYNNDALLEVKTYRYQNGITHRQGLDFCGFEKITVSDSLRNQAVTRTFDPLRFGVLTSENGPASSVTNTWNVAVFANKRAKITLSKSVATDKLKSTTRTTTYTYDTYGNPAQIITDYGGGLKTTTSNVFSNFTASPYRLGELKQQSIKNERSGQTAVTTKTVFTYNNMGLPLTKTAYYNSSKVSEENWAYDANNRLKETKTRTYSSTNWQTRSYEYDNPGRLTKETGPTGLSVEYAYNSKGQLEAQKNHKGQQTTFEYDNWGRKTKTTYPDGTVETSSYAFVSSLKDAWMRVTRTATGQPSTITFFDAMMREIRSGEQRFNSTIIYTDKKYDQFGRLRQVSLPFKTTPLQWNEYKYDEFDRLTELSYASGKKDLFAYSGNSVTSTVDGVTQTTQYNAKGEVTSITGAAGTITYQLRADGQPASIVAPGSITTTFAYDTYGRQTVINDPSAGQRAFGYDAAGNISLEEDSRNKQIKYTYDTRNRLTKKEITGEQTVEITYNADNLPQSAISSNGTKTEYTYDAYLRPSTIKETGLDGKWLKKTVSYENGNIKTVNYTSSSGNLATENYVYAYGHNTEVSLTSPHFSGTKSIWKLTGENAMGQATGAKTGTLNRSYRYDNYGLPAERKIYKPEDMTGATNLETATKDVSRRALGTGAVASTDTVRQDFLYSFDARTGNLTGRQDASNSRSLQESFTYDNLNRLTGVGNTYIRYDNKGNITVNAATGTFKYTNAAQPYQLTEATPLNGSTPLRVQDITYNAMQRPASITENNRTATISYNADGDRVKMLLKNGTSTTLTRYYFGNKYEIDVAPSGTKEKLYLCGGAYSAPAVFVKESGTWRLYYIGRDYQGSITHIFNEDGTVKQESSYDAWGRLRNPANQQVYAVDSEPELFLGRGYTGHEHLVPFGLINMNARLYDAALGRFLSPDPYIQDMTNSQNFNRYSYCLNNPLRYTDPSGENYYWDPDMRCYRDEKGDRVDYWDVYRFAFDNGYFRLGGSMFHRYASYGYGYSYSSGYGAGYAGYGFKDGGTFVINGLAHNSKNYYWSQTVFVNGFNTQYGGFYPTEMGVINTKVTYSQQARDWMNAMSFMLGSASTTTTILGKNHKYNELWHQTKTRGISTALNKNRWKNPGAKYWRNVQTNPFQGIRTAGKGLNKGGLALVGVDIVLSGELKPSQAINAAMSFAAFSGVGSLIAGVWFVADFGTMGVNYLLGNGAVGLGDMLDDAIGTYEMYEGLY